MSKSLVFGLLSVVMLVLTMVSALAVCYEKGYDYKGAEAYSKICCSYDPASRLLTYSCTGDRAYWSDAPVDCDADGCGMVDPYKDASTISKSGTRSLSAVGTNYITCWDRDEDSAGYFAWAYSYCSQDFVSAPAPAPVPGTEQRCGDGVCESSYLDDGIIYNEHQACPRDCSSPSEVGWLDSLIEQLLGFLRQLFSSLGVGSLSGSGIGFGGGGGGSD